MHTESTDFASSKIMFLGDENLLQEITELVRLMMKSRECESDLFKH
jgi:hypothetical protein